MFTNDVACDRHFAFGRHTHGHGKLGVMDCKLCICLY